jgi:hypothetical protein
MGFFVLFGELQIVARRWLAPRCKENRCLILIINYFGTLIEKRLLNSDKV